MPRALTLRSYIAGRYRAAENTLPPARCSLSPMATTRQAIGDDISSMHHVDCDNVAAIARRRQLRPRRSFLKIYAAIAAASAGLTPMMAATRSG